MDWNCKVVVPSFSVVTAYAGFAVPVVTVGGAVVPVPDRKPLSGCDIEDSGASLPDNAVPPNVDFPKRLLPPPNALVDVEGWLKADVVVAAAG